MRPVAAWIFGGIYYTGLGKWWMAAQGKALEQCKAEQASKSAVAMAAPFVLVFLAEIIMAWVLYGILVHLNMFTMRAGLISGALCWLGFVVTTIASNNAFSNRKALLTQRGLARRIADHRGDPRRLWPLKDGKSGLNLQPKGQFVRLVANQGVVA